MVGDPTESGWAFVAETDGSARLMDALTELDPEETYTRTDIAETAGVPLKTLYLDGTVEECASLGLFDRVETDGEGEPRYRLDPDSEVYRAASRFDAAVGDRAVAGDAEG